MKVTCTTCEALIPATQINVATDVAVCPQCDEVFVLSSLVLTQDVPPDFDLDNPPAGAWYINDFQGWRIGATTRTYNAFFLVPFMCVWSGLSLGGIYGTQIVKGEFDLGMSLFGIPFVLGTLVFGTIALMSAIGRVEISVQDKAGRIFTGIGPFGWTRRFDWSEVTRIEEDVLSYEYSGSNGRVIALIGKSRLKCASMMTDPRRYFLLHGLRTLHRSR